MYSLGLFNGCRLFGMKIIRLFVTGHFLLSFEASIGIFDFFLLRGFGIRAVAWEGARMAMPPPPKASHLLPKENFHPD